MRTHYCGQVDEKLIGQTVEVAGWVHRRRDHGGVIFVDLRDREGLLQVVFDPDRAEVFREAERLRNEFVVQREGQGARAPGGHGERQSRHPARWSCWRAELELLNRSEPLPFQLDEQVSEEVRLKYRYLDLRRRGDEQRLRLRHRITRAMRGYLDAHGFIDLETPMLTKATPEGARDYLVPSRTHPGKFFALPQSPQIFKQLLMIAGFDRYYQIVRCFRDEDLRADRQPEFTQLDIETSFLTQDADHGARWKDCIRHLFSEVLGVDAARSVPAHDLRRGDAPLRLRQAGPAHPAGAGGRGRSGQGLRLQGVRRSRQRPEGPGRGAARAGRRRDAAPARSTTTPPSSARYGAKGLAYIKVNERAKGRDGLQSPIIKFLSDAAIAGILERTGAADNDLIFFGADSAKVVSDALGALRLKIGQDLKLVQPGWRPLWVVDFPMFEWDADEQALGGHAPSLHLAARSTIRRRCAPIRSRRSPRPTTWC